jgi:hypothetical protein
MKTVTNDFKTVAKGDAKELAVTITDGTTTITGSDDVSSFKIFSNGGIYRTVLRQAEVKYWGDSDFLDKYLNIKLGFKVGASFEYIDYGDFKVVEVTEDKANDLRTLKLYDRMYEALQEYETMGTYPQDIATLLGAICTELGWTLATSTFFNDDLEIVQEIFTNQNLTYRDVLNYIAEVTGTIILFNEDDELELRSIDTSTSLETLVTNDMFSLKLEPKWGELNSLVLAREPQEDNIVEQDEASITANGLWELRFVNNLILDSDRETYITPLFNEIKGLEYYPFESKTVGLGYLEVGDVITVTDKADATYKVLITDVEMSVSGGLSEVIKGVSPDKSTTDYKTAGIIGKRITNTEIVVNKQEGEIELINEAMETVATIPRQATEPEDPEEDDLWLNTTDNIIYIYDGLNWQPTAIQMDALEGYYTKGETTAQITVRTDDIQLAVEDLETRTSLVETEVDENGNAIEAVEGDIATLELRADSLELDIESVGGSNLLKNSVGMKGTIEEWQDLDENGDPVDTDNDGTVVKTSDVEENTESGSAIRIDEQFIAQDIPTIVDGEYTIYLRFNKLLDLDLDITGVTETLSITAGDYVDETWAVYQYQFTANSEITQIKISNVDSGAGAYAILSDMVVKLGYASGWVQAPNEVYGKNFRFDEEGFSVTSLTDDFKATLDNTKLGIYDTTSGSDRIMALFSKDEGLITKLVAQDELAIQRYENSNKSARFIPTSTGLMITIND